MSRRELFRVERLPVLQNRLFPTREAALDSPTGDVVLVQDVATGLVFNAAFDAKKLVYDEEYQNEQACSPAFQKHLHAVADVVDRHFRGSSLIEVGCGKGYFLEHLLQLGYEVTGIDPAYEGANTRVIKAPFERGLGVSADAIVLRHVLEHVADPLAFLADIAHANGGRGCIYIEVPCLDWIMQHRAWFDIFYEHVNYFRLQDFDRLFGTVRENGRFFGGQYLYVVADLATLRPPCADRSSAAEFPSDFLRSVERCATIARANRRNAIWGGASKGVVFAIHMSRAGAAPDFAIDINPAKHRRFLPGSGLRVLPPADALRELEADDNIFVMNSNYLEEIVAQSGNRYSYQQVDHG